MIRAAAPNWGPRRLLAALLVVLPLLAAGMGCVDDVAPLAAADTAPPTEFDGERALAHVAAQTAFGPRHVGALGHAQTVSWLQTTLLDAGYASTVVEFPVPQSGAVGRNVVAWAGSGPALVLGAHYDTRLRADNDPDPAQRDSPPLGANDGASGVAVLVELAQVLNLDAVGHTVCLMFFDAEDNGLIGEWDWVLGSSYQAANPQTVPACAAPRAVVVVDMVGDADQAIYRDISGHRSLQNALFATAKRLGFEDFIIDVPRFDILDDHRPFADRGIPATVLIDFEYSAWHTSFDTLDRVAATSLVRVGQTMELWLEEGAPF